MDSLPSPEVNPYFTVVVPTYNRAGLIGITIESILKQTFDSFEVIIVDDGSSDKTAEVVASFKDLRIKYFKIVNKERGAARNYGIGKAIGKYITFCDSDDIFYPDHLSNASESIHKYGEVPWMHLGYAIQRRRGFPVKMAWMQQNFIVNLAKGNPLSCMGVFVKKEIIRENQFNENRHLAGSEDWELWLRLASKYPIIFDQRVSAMLIMHEERSVVHTGELKLLLRKFLSIGYAFDDENVQITFGKYRLMMEAYFDTYLALHLLLDRKNLLAVKYIWFGFRKYPGCILERRFLALIKHFMYNLIGIK